MNKNLEKVKCEKGVTMLSLAISMTILLVISAIVISVATADNGILEKTDEAVDKYEEYKEEETQNLDGVKTDIEDMFLGN